MQQATIGRGQGLQKKGKRHQQKNEQQMKQRKKSYFNNINYVSLQCLQYAYQDQNTCTAYQQAIYDHAYLFNGKKVLHITRNANCLYSIFAAEAGASQVFCVVNGHCQKQAQNVFMMKQIIKQHTNSILKYADQKYEESNKNFLESNISVMFWKDFNQEIDIIISQPMGHCLYFDSLIDRTIEAKDLYLKKGTGLMFPNVLNFKAAFIKDDHYIDRKSGFWDQLYGIKMTSMKSWICNQPIIRNVDPSLLVSQITKFLVFDLQQTQYSQLERFERKFQIRSNEEAIAKIDKKKTEQQQGINKQKNEVIANGLVVWFECQFTNGDRKVQLKASPWNKDATRWTHSTFYSSSKEGWTMKQKNVLVMNAEKSFKDNTGLIKLKINECQQLYSFSA